jgi:hypothetical protein
MANHSQTSEPRLAEIVSGIANDAQELVKHQLTLFKTEVRQDFRRTRDAALILACGFLLAILGGGLLAHALAHWLAWAFPDLSLWTCYSIVALALLAVGGGIIYLGKRQLDTINPLPDETADAVKENVQWLMKSKTPS